MRAVKFSLTVPSASLQFFWSFHFVRVAGIIKRATPFHAYPSCFIAAKSSHASLWSDALDGPPYSCSFVDKKKNLLVCAQKQKSTPYVLLLALPYLQLHAPFFSFLSSPFFRSVVKYFFLLLVILDAFAQFIDYIYILSCASVFAEIKSPTLITRETKYIGEYQQRTR